MQNISSEEALSELLQSSPAVLLLYGGASCGVCMAIKPRLEKLASEEFPKLVTAYIDCQEAAVGPLCAARGIFLCRLFSCGLMGSDSRNSPGFSPSPMFVRRWSGLIGF